MAAPFNSTAMGSMGLKCGPCADTFLCRKSPLTLPIIPRILFNSRSVELCSLSQPPAASLLGVGNECHLVSSMLFSITHGQDAMRGQKLFHGCVHWEKRQINSNVTNVKGERHIAQPLWCLTPFVHRCEFINGAANGGGPAEVWFRSWGSLPLLVTGGIPIKKKTAATAEKSWTVRRGRWS